MTPLPITKRRPRYLRIFSGTSGSLAALLFALLAIAPAAFAESAPRVGLVLSGGGARGGAHIGVLEVLERERVPIACIAGTSMGALVGGAFAAGVPPASMEESVTTINWKDIFVDSPSDARLEFRRKQIARRFIPGAELGVKPDGIDIPEGAIAGEKIKLVLNELVGSFFGERYIEDLSLPLSLIATDIGTGDRVVLRDGSLTTAMRASMSIPGAMEPVVIDGHKLVDGWLVDNMPIGEVRERCDADVIIVVDVSTPLLPPEEVHSVVSVITQQLGILSRQNGAASLATLTPRDLHIKPKLGSMSTSGFDEIAGAIAAGREAAAAMVELIRPLGVGAEQYATWRAQILGSTPKPARIDRIEIAPMRYVRPTAVLRKLRVKPGDILDPKSLGEDLLDVYALGDFRSVDYQLKQEDGVNVLEITARERPWGPDYLRFGLNLGTDFQEDSFFTLRAAYHRTWVNHRGAEWLTVAQIGQQRGISTEWYQPVDRWQRWFYSASAEYSSELTGIYLDDERLAEYRNDIFSLGLDAGYRIGRFGSVRAGWRAARVDNTLTTGITAIFPDIEENSNGPVAELRLDSFDRLYFPDHGNSLLIALARRRADEGAGSDRYSRGDLAWEGAWTWSRYTFRLGAAATESFDGQLPVHDSARLGGLFRLSGLASNQIIGDEMRFANLRGERELFRLPVLGSMRAGLSLETGRMNVRYTELNLDGWQNSVALYLAAPTSIGPFVFAVGHASNDSTAAYLTIGTP